MKKIFLLLFSFSMFISVHVFAQAVKYTTHKLAQGETLSMLAEKYKTTVGDIMRLNGMHADTKLVVGEDIKIPSGGQAVVRTGDKKTTPPPPPPAITKPVTTTAVNTGSSTLTHIVQPKETLYAISKKYGVTVDQIKQWNHLPDNNLETGQELAVNAKGVAVAEANRAKQAETKPVVNVPDNTPPVKKETVAVNNNAGNTTVAAEPVTKPVIDITPEVKTKERPTTTAAADGSDNFFANLFKENNAGKSITNTSGTAMIFKTASGWSDKKYYVLMNEAPSGSIVKISAPNGNVIYAKVLWKLDDMRENKGLQFRISEAGAAALNVQGDKFPLSIQYFQ